MIATDTPITFIPNPKTSRIIMAASVTNAFPFLKNSVIANNPGDNAPFISISTTRVFATFSASTLSGTISVTQNSTIVTGVDTFFLDELVVGDVVTIEGEQLTVDSIQSNTQFTTTTPFLGPTQINIELITKSPRPTLTLSVTLTIGGADFTTKLIGGMDIDWPDDGGGSCNFTLVRSNPFASGGDLVKIDDLVQVNVTFTDAAGTAFTTKVFKGKVVQWDTDPDNELLSVDCQDLSRDVSKETDKLNQEILGVDPIFVETRRSSTNIAGNVVIITSKRLDTLTDNPVFGIWLETDTARATNLAEQVDFVIPNATTIEILPTTTGKIVSGRNYVIRYALNIDDFTKSEKVKSEIVSQIAQLAGIPSLINERAGKVEDELVGVNVVANQEFPMDIIRKVILPQTWKAEFTENGDLLIRRERIKTNADFLFNESSILEQTLTVTKSIDGVINEQKVTGIKKRLGKL